MAFEFDASTATPDGFDPSTATPVKPAGAIRKLADLGLSAAKGVVAVPEAAVGLADLATGGRAGKTIQDLGVRFKDAKDVLTGLQSDDLKSKQEQFQDADGILAKTGVALSNPSLIANTVAESVPLMGAGAVPARAVMAIAPKVGAVGAGAIGEGTAGAGAAAEGIRQQTTDGLLTGKQAGLAGATGLATAGFGAVGGKLAQKLGIADVDTALAGGAARVLKPGEAPKGLIRRAGEGAVAEGLLEELPQSVSEQALQNVALDRPVTQGLEDAAVMGTLAGGAMGAGAGALTRQQAAPATSIPVTDPIAQPEVETPVAPTRSQAMGINPQAGPIQAAAAIAVDSGAHDAELAKQAAQAAQDATKGGANKPKDTPVPAGGPAQNVNPETGEIISAYDLRQRDAPQTQPGDIFSATGEPFNNALAAKKTAKELGEGHQAIKLGTRQFVVRKVANDSPSSDVQPVAAGTDGTGGAIAETGMGAGVGNNRAPERAVDTGSDGSQPDSVAVPLAAGRVPLTANPQPTTLGKPVAATPAGLGFTAANTINPKEPASVTQADQTQQSSPKRQEAPPAIAQPASGGAVQPATEAAQPATGIDAAADQAATSPLNDLPQPTQGQKEAGNYAKGHHTLNGLDLSIENPAGSTRSGVDKAGKPWSNTIKHHYGYIKGTVGNDKDHVDVFVKPGTPDDFSGQVFVIDQFDGDKFDEHKVVIGAKSGLEARQIYQANYAKGWKGGKAITPMDFDAFKTWVKDGQKNKPLAGNAAKIPATSSLEKTASWVIRNKETGEVMMETFDQKKVDALNTAKYEAVPIAEHLASLSTPKKQAEPNTSPEPVPKAAEKEQVEQPTLNVGRTGKERIDALKDVKAGTITPDELKEAYPAKEMTAEQFRALPEDVRNANRDLAALDAEVDAIEKFKPLNPQMLAKQSEQLNELTRRKQELISKGATQAGADRVMAELKATPASQPIKVGDTLRHTDGNDYTVVDVYGNTVDAERIASQGGGVTQKNGISLDAIDAIAARKLAQKPAAKIEDSGPLFSRTQATTETSAFKNWFGNSVVTENGKPGGKPLVVYHGTNKDFSEFKPEFLYSGEGASQTGSGFYFTTSHESAGGYTGKQDGSNIMPVYLSLKNPLFIDFKDGEVSGADLKLTRAQVQKIILSHKDIRTEDSPLMNFGDIAYEGFDKVLKEAVDSYVGSSNIASLRNDIFGNDNAAWLKAFSDATGYDSAYTITATGDKHYVAWFPNQIKSATGNNGEYGPSGDINFSRAPFYSALTREVGNIPAKSQSGMGWAMNIAGLVKAGKVKQDEVEWSGITDFLKITEGKITKEQITDFLNANGVKVTETVLGDEQHFRNADGNRVFDEETGDFIASKAPTKYANYQLPGGTNYIEVLLTLPPAPRKGRFDVMSRKDKSILKKTDSREEAQAWIEANAGMPAAKGAEIVERQAGQPSSPEYKSSHWDQPNVLAHVRLNDRTDADGRKVLFIEELQSDWGQAGKKEGFIQSIGPRTHEIGPAMLSSRDTEPKGFGIYRKGETDTGAATAIYKTLAEAEAALASGEKESSGGRVPNAPFVGKTDAWVSLALKRVIKMAVDGGYDKVAFVNGEQSAERYDLSKHISKINYGILEGGEYNLEISDINGTRLDNVDLRRVPESRLEDVVGKEVAKKIIDGEGVAEKGGRKVLSGLDLKVGGEGMKAFYDKIVPSVTKDVLRKLGGGQMEVVYGASSRVAGFDQTNAFGQQPGFIINPAMREKAADGVPLFSQGLVRNPTTVAALQQAVRQLTGITGNLPNQLGRVVATTSADVKSTWEPLIGRKGLLQAEDPKGDALAFFDPGTKTVFLLADRITKGDETAVLAHELMHKHGQAVLGKDGWDRLHGVIGTWADARKGTDERTVYDYAKRRVDAIGQELSNQELFPYAVEAALKLGIKPNAVGQQGTVARWLAEVMQSMKAAWEKIVGKPGTFKAQDLVNLAFGIAQRENPEYAKVGNALREPTAPDSGGAQTDTPAFKAWFGNSVVTDTGKAGGVPMVVYHGTSGNFSEFDEAFAGSTTFSASGLDGFYFTADADIASRYSKVAQKTQHEKFGRFYSNANVMPVYLALQNPMVYERQRGDASSLMDTLKRRVLSEAKEGGHDGVVFQGFKDTPTGRGASSDVYVVFRPSQIKSATGNRGTFDTTNPDIRFSRSIGDTLKNITVTDIKARTGNKLADYRGLGLQFLGGRQIVDLYAKDLPQLNGYTQMVQQMSADANEVGAQADAIANGWAKLADERKLAELMHDATLAQIDPAKDYVTGDNRLQWGALNAKFKALSDDAKKVYTQARDAYEEHYAQVREAIRDKIERSEMTSASKAAMLERMDGEFFDKIKGVYFPLARFGKYVVVTRGPGGNVVNVSRAETLNEAETTRDLMRKTYPTAQGFAVGKVLKDKEFNAARDSVSRGFLKDLFGVLDEKGMGEELQDAVNQLYLASMPDLSWAKHGIHRKGTPGFSQDARRAFAQNMFHGARYLAKLRYADQLQDKLTGMQNFVEAKAGDEAFDSVKAQQVVDELNKRHDSLMNPKSNPLSTALTSFGFVFHMGLSPASAMVNLSGTAMVAYPIMGAKWGFDKAAGALMTAAKQAATNKNNIGAVLQGDERRAYDAAVKSGTIDVTAAHDLAGIAQGEDAGVMWRMRPVMKWASFMFHHAERFNRQVTFVAAYRLARDTGAAHDVAFEQATKATYDGHFDYSAQNRPRVMQGNAAKVLLLFKQYGQNMIYTLARQAQLAMKAETPEGRKEARKALGGLLVMHAAGAGVLGLPLVGTLLAVASMLGGSDDEPWDAETALRNMLADTFGQKPAEVMAKGFSRLTPWDISGRVGLNHLILPDIQEGLEGQRLAESVMAAALGPVAGIGVNLARGMQEISEGHLGRGIESMLPSALRAPMKAMRYEMEGAKDKTGVSIKDEVGAAGVAGQALGFSPSEVRNATEGRSAIFAADKRLMARRADLMRQHVQAVEAKDPEAVAEVRAKILAFNEKNPTRRINGMNLAMSLKAHAKRVNEAQEGVFLPQKRRDALEAGRFAAAN